MTFKIGLSSVCGDDDMVTLESLGLTEPDWTFQKYAETVDVLAGGKFGRGFSSATWAFAAARSNVRAALRVYCPDLSAEVCIATPTNEEDGNGLPVFKNYQAVMNWMTGQEDKAASNTMDFTITFTHLLEIV